MTRSKASNEAQYRYNREHLKRVPLDVQLSEYEMIKAAAEASGESVNGFIKAAIRQRMEREGFRLVDPATLGEMGAPEVGGVNPVSTEK